jgi:hypothetical protein
MFSITRLLRAVHQRTLTLRLPRGANRGNISASLPFWHHAPQDYHSMKKAYRIDGRLLTEQDLIQLVVAEQLLGLVGRRVHAAVPVFDAWFKSKPPGSVA